MPDFRTTCHINAAVLVALFLVYLILPGLPLVAFDQTVTPETRFVTRRSGIVFLGLAAMLMLARDAPASVSRQAIAIGMIVIWGGLAIFGAQAILRGIAGWMTWGTVVVEVVLAVLFVPHLRSGVAER
ncbi:hypothetical protein OCH239_04975 [Roseivivax halodurans JCM 10272]|uniref:DUF4345 domain-containing protein n=1 Tax=Roseivivax halodurans JCM 10272 TaxID=1449350 RepID=X7EE35_9RHOB|nr:hypothetical protein [Roseivivax halodurans]ETX14207.1 hypothetical protein OCH239_04975 [Roseivivax halodurans JCM 10272]